MNLALLPASKATHFNEGKRNIGNMSGGRFLVSLKDVEDLLVDIELVSDVRISLSGKTREVSGYVAGYIANKVQKFCEGCCKKRLVDENTTDGVYHKLLRIVF